MSKPTYKELEERLKIIEKTERHQTDLDQALRESEEKYRTLTENIAVGIFRSSPGSRGRFIEVNHALVSMLGFESKQELLKQDVAGIYLNSEDRRRFSEKIIRDGYVKHEELFIQRKDGKPLVVSVTAISVRDSKSNIVYFDGIVEDVTERREEQEELLLQKTYLEKLFNSAPEAIALHGNDDRIIDINDEFTSIFGYTREEAKGALINDLIAPADYGEEAQNISQMVLRGERIALETKRKRKDGTLVDVSVLGAPILHEGKQIGDYAIYRDITERKRADEELLIQKTYLERLFNSAPEAIVLHDTNDLVIDVNEEFTNLFGFSREEAVGKPINELVAPENFLDEAAFLSHQVVNGERVEAETRRRRKDGSLVDVSILGAPIVYGQKQMGVYAIYRDITEHKKAEQGRIRRQEEARMAREIQMNFLPDTNPSIPGYDIAGKSIPALNVGGDYYDFIPIDSKRLVITVGDVSGNGLAASLVMANLQATVRALSMFITDPAACLEKANKLLLRSTDKKTFITLFYGILDTSTHTLVYANAGQDLPLLFRPQSQPNTLKQHGLMLGVKEEATYHNQKIMLYPGDRLLIYTDGIPEAMNQHLDEFGDARIVRSLQQNDKPVASAVIDDLIGAVQDHCENLRPEDDMTVVLLSRSDG